LFTGGGKLHVSTALATAAQRLALRHARLIQEAKLELREAQAALTLLGAATPVNRGAALGLAELLSVRRQTRAGRDTCPLGERGVETSSMPTSLDNGKRAPKGLLRKVVARLLGRKV
jgi:hypothetical protein